MVYTLEMNYRDTQSRLMTDTYYLLLLFILCSAGMMLVSTIIFFYLYLFFYHMFSSSYFNSTPSNIWYALAIFNLVIILYMYCAYRFRISLLKSGGANIAEYCGAKEITADNTDYYSKRFQDVVEEMAVACSVPVPRTFILNSCNNINAFAAGYEPEDAAITITRGAMTQLNRDELQALVAHEFSHIVHQDMRLNMQLIAFNASINSFLEFAWILDPHSYETPLQYLLIPLAPIIVIMLPFGLVGSLFSALMKLGVNRKREFLADASAIRYTRYAPGLLGALKKIGGVPSSRDFDNSTLRFVSHMMFDNQSNVSDLASSHPSLMKRIQLFEPTFTNSKMLALRHQYEQQLPDGKEEDRELGYCPDGENYIRNPEHVAANMSNEKSSDYMAQLQKIHGQALPGDTANRLFMLSMIALISLLMFIAGNSLYKTITPPTNLPAGMMVQTDPQIIPDTGIPGLVVDHITITPIAKITMQARVLNAVTYKNDHLSGIAAQELFLGWKNMSDSSYIDKVKFGLSDRTYGYVYSASINPSDVCDHTAHALIIPATPEIAQFMSKIKTNNIINITGSIVNLALPNNRRINSTFCDPQNPSRINSYNIWVESVEIVK